MDVSIIVAIADNGVIGRDNGMPWRLSDDLRRFKARTMRHHLLIGRKTWESIGRPLPGREIIVVSSADAELPAGVHCVRSVEEGIERARSLGETELFVAGGESIYAAVLPLCNRLYLTHVHHDVAGDVSFPPLDWDDWQEVSSTPFDADERNDYPTTYSEYRRAPAQTPPALGTATFFAALIQSLQHHGRAGITPTAPPNDHQEASGRPLRGRAG